MSKQYTIPKVGKFSDTELGKQITIPKIGKLTMFPAPAPVGGIVVLRRRIQGR